MVNGRDGGAPLHIDPDLAGALITPDIGPTIRPQDIPALRRAILESQSADETTLRRDGAVELTRVRANAAAGEVSLLVLRPVKVPDSAPVVLFLHGGGLISGDETTGIAPILDWACELGTHLVSVNYRLAPEHSHPAALDDCYSALEWIASRGAADETDIVVIGVSAGGGLAAAATLRARDQGGPRVRAQMLIYPMLDDRARLASSHELVGEGVWDSVSNRTGWDAYLAGRAGSPEIPYLAAPSRAPDLTGLPSTYIDVGTVDTFRDEILEFGGRLASARVSTEMHLWPGAFHGFDTAVPSAAISKAADAARTNWLRRVLGRTQA